jgi:hypothetical protein
MNDERITLEEHYILEAYRLLTDEEKEFIMWLSGLASAGLMSADEFKNVLWNLARKHNQD